MNIVVFGKTMEIVRNHRDTKLITTKEGRNNLASEPKYHTTKVFKEKLLAIEVKRTKTLIYKPVYLGLSILEMNNTVMHEI